MINRFLISRTQNANARSLSTPSLEIIPNKNPNVNDQLNKSLNFQWCLNAPDDLDKWAPKCAIVEPKVNTLNRKVLLESQSQTGWSLDPDKRCTSLRRRCANSSLMSEISTRGETNTLIFQPLLHWWEMAGPAGSWATMKRSGKSSLKEMFEHHFSNKSRVSLPLLAPIATLKKKMSLTDRNSFEKGEKEPR